MHTRVTHVQWYHNGPHDYHDQHSSRHERTFGRELFTCPHSNYLNSARSSGRCHQNIVVESTDAIITVTVVVIRVCNACGYSSFIWEFGSLLWIPTTTTDNRVVYIERGIMSVIPTALETMWLIVPPHSWWCSNLTSKVIQKPYMLYGSVPLVFALRSMGHVTILFPACESVQHVTVSVSHVCRPMTFLM